MRQKGINKTATSPMIIKVFLVLSFISLLALPAHAGWTDCATDWANFDNPGFVTEYTYKGDIIRDHESTGTGDPTHGQANVPPADTDLSSGANGTNPGPYATPYFGYYDGGTEYDPEDPSTMEDDYILFRMRVAGDPRKGLAFSNYHWNILLDIDADGYKEYWVDLEGKYSQSGYDRLNILYDNSNRQDIPDPDASGVRVEYFSAYHSEDGSCAAPSPGYSHTRVVPTGTNYWIEIQVPMTAFNDSYGNQVLYPDSPVAFIFSTGASANDPLQKDWMMDLNFLSLADPITFGDIVRPDGYPIIEFTDSSLDPVSFYTVRPYPDGDFVYVYVKDAFANINKVCSVTTTTDCVDDGDCPVGETCTVDVVDTIQVTVTNPDITILDDEVLTLVETSPTSGIFTNTVNRCSISGTSCTLDTDCPLYPDETCLTSESLQTVSTNGTPDDSDNNNYLEAESGDTIYVSYTNPKSNTVTDEADIVEACEAYIEFTRANGDPSDNFILTNDIDTSDKLYVTIYHSEANTDPTTQQTIDIDLTGLDSQSNFTLTETGNDTGVFRNTTGLDTQISDGFIVSDDGLWEDIDGGIVTATYGYTCSSNPYTITATAQLFVTLGGGRAYFTNGSGTQDIELYTANQPVFVKVVDSSACTTTHASGIETLDVTIRNDTGDEEVITLYEVSPGSSVFMNRINDLVTTSGSNVVSSDLLDDIYPTLSIGDTFVIATGPDVGTYTVQNVDWVSNEVTLDRNLSSTETGIGYNAYPLMTVTGSAITGNNILESSDESTPLTVTYTDCDDGDSDPSNDDKIDNATYNAPFIVINEVLFYPDSDTCQTEYIQLYNSSTVAVNVSGYKISDNDPVAPWIYTIPTIDGGIVLAPGEKIYISLYQSGTSPTDQYDSGTGTWYLFDTTSPDFPSDYFGDPDSLDPADQISLYNTSGQILDYVAWSATLLPSVDFLGDDSDAVAMGIWQDDAFVNVVLMTKGWAIKRSTDGLDSNSPNDWEYNITANICDIIITRALISSFKAYVESGHVVVQWDTDSEIGTIGFHIFRKDDVTGKYSQLNDELLPGLLVSPQGGTYRYIDETAWPEKTYTYALLEVEYRGKYRIHGPYTVTATNQGLATSDVAMTSHNYSRKAHDITAAKKSRSKGSKLTLKEKSLKISRPEKGGTFTDNFSVKAKIALTENGLYYLDASEIASLLDINKVQKIIKNNQLLLTNRGKEVAYLPSKDYSRIYFYGEAIDSIYTDENVYWLEKGSGLKMKNTRGKRPAPANGNETFTENINAEEDNWSVIGLFSDPQSDYWIWDYIVAGNATLDTKTFNIEANGVAVSQEPASLTIQFFGSTNTDHHVVVTLNGTKIGESFWYGTRAHTFTTSFSQSLLTEGTNYIAIKGILDTGVPFSVLFVDSFDLSYQRLYRAYNDRLTVKGDGNPVVSIEGFTDSDIVVFDISDPKNPKYVIGTTIDSLGPDNYRVSFVPASPESEYLALTPYGLSTQLSLFSDTASNLNDRSNAVDYLVITPEGLAATAQSLADYRQSQGLKTKVVVLEDIMDEFNYGIYSPEAIKDFLTYAYHNWTKAPRYVVLIGEGTFDYKDNEGYGDNLLPPIIIGTPHGLFPSDNHYADIDGDHVPEMAIGRLPVATLEELQAVINKITVYENSGIGNWTERVLMLADNPEEDGDFPADSNDVASILPPTYGADKIYLSEHTTGEARQLVMTGINSGALLVNYIGHAGLDRLAQEGMLLSSDVASMTNWDRLPVLTAITCAVGQFAIPGYDSLAEVFVLGQNGGAIAVWAPTGLSVNSEAVILDKEFFRSAFNYNRQVLGDIVLEALEYGRMNGVSDYILDIYNILGDPALLLK